MMDIIAKYIYPTLKALSLILTYEGEVTLEEVNEVLATVVRGVPEGESNITIASIEDVRRILMNVIQGDVTPDNAKEYVKYKIVQGHTPSNTKGVINIYYVPGYDTTHHFGENTIDVFRPKVRITITGFNYVSGLHATLFIKDVFKIKKLDAGGAAGVFLEGDVNYLGYNEEGNPEFELDYKSIIIN